MYKQDRQEIYLIVAEAFEKVMLPHITEIKETLDNHGTRLGNIEATQADHGTRLENIEATQDDHSGQLESIEHKLDSTISRVEIHSRRLQI